ncbi:necrosis inducing protein [Aspergillus crustosus]
MRLLNPSNLALVAPIFESCMASLLTPFPTTASDGALKFQPVLDFDKDSCYHTAAIGTDGTLNEGIAVPWGTENPEPVPTPMLFSGLTTGNETELRSGSAYTPGNCRNRDRLDHSQVYVRERCNHGWCAYLYAYYFEADRGWGNRHKHDWEHVIVWTLNDNVFFVSWSAHGDYTTNHQLNVRFEGGTHPKIVYHLGGWGTHSLKLAEAKDDGNIENETGGWFAAPLVSLEKLSCDVNRKLLRNDWGSAHMDLPARVFGEKLDKWMPWDARNNEHFDPFEPVVPAWAVGG